MRLPALSALLLALPAAAFANGNVTTTQTGDSITIRGDAGDNDYDVKYGTDTNGNDVLVIEGKNGTTINGTPKFEIVLDGGATRFTKLQVPRSDGSDHVTVDLSGLPAEKRFTELDVDGAFEGTTTVKNVQMEAKGKIEVRPGGEVTIESCDTTNLSVRGGADATVTVNDCNVERKLTVDTPAEGVGVTVQDSFIGGEVRIKGGSKLDVQRRLEFRIQRSTTRKVSFQSGSADDEVAFEDSTVDQVSVKMGDGADLISFAGSMIETVSLDGGPGALDCYDETVDGNVIGSLKQKGFEPEGCGELALEFFDPGSDPFEPAPEDAVAWRTFNPENGHSDGPYALPGAANPLGLPVLDPAEVEPPAHWGVGPECTAGPVELPHLHDAFAGHADPASPTCGHGILEWGRLVPAP